MVIVLLLATWSLHRLRSRALFWARFLSLIVDWVSLIYVFVPGVALLSFMGWKYFHGAFTSQLVGRESSADTLLPLVMMFVVTLLLLLWHWLTFGNIPFTLESGDAVFTFLSPLSRKQLVLTLWLEGWGWSLLPLLILYALMIPLLPYMHVIQSAWFVLLVTLAAYESAIRLISQLWNNSDALNWTRWLMFNSGRIATAVPVTVGVSRELTGGGWAITALFAVITVVCLGLTYRYLMRRPWDGWMRFRPSRLVNLAMMAVPVDTDDASKVQFRMRLPARWLVHSIELIETRWFQRRPMKPLSWLLMLRVLRRKQVFRDVGALTVAALMVERLSPIMWVKVLGLGFCAFMMVQWWKIVVTPLAEKPIQEQTLVDPWMLRVERNHLRVNTVVISLLIWVGLGFLIGAW
ncbi:hypothetical protein JZ785_23675 [Alicyclobacillus curvatus]|nr:hypothetical protein JZ785_23675 [Alicyclobacillus curvatus]